jgi:hypothetical protein
MPRIAILTFCVGADYKKAMEPGLQSKREYAKQHGYAFHEGGDDVWDRTRPIPWSKFKFIEKFLDDYDYLFWSDADAILLNHTLRLEDHVLPLLPADKDLLWSFDACNHYNNGHLLIRGKSAWVRDYFRRAYAQTDLLYHIWWDNAAMIRLFDTNPTDKSKMETCRDHWLFNAYVFGSNNKATSPSDRLYRPGDFLIHFAGVYDPWNIYRMMMYVRGQAAKGAPLDPALLEAWRVSPPSSKSAADASLALL